MRITKALLDGTKTVSIDMANLTALSIEDLGCKRGAGFKDNAKIINEALQAMAHAQHLSWDVPFAEKTGLIPIHVPLYVPGGEWALYEPIVFPSTTGLRMMGNGVGIQCGNWHYNSGVGGPCSRFVWYGDPEDPKGCLLNLKSAGAVIDGLVLQGVPLPENTFDYKGRPFVKNAVVIDGSDGHGTNIPTSKTHFPNLTVFCAKTGIHFSPVVQSLADNLICGHLHMENVWTGVHCTNQQSLGHTFTHFEFNGGNPQQKMFHYETGGSMSCQTALINGNATVLTIDEVAQNTNIFEIRNIRLDPQATAEAWDYQLLHMRKPGFAANCVFTGQIGSNWHVFKPKRPFIEIAPGAQVDIEGVMWSINGRQWARGGEVLTASRQVR